MTWGHYVPQFYIRNFGINQKQTARLDKKTGIKAAVAIESFCAEENYFSFDEESLANLPEHLRWIDKDLIERQLASGIEGPIASILQSIINAKSLASVSKDEILMLLEWAAWIFIASPTSLAINSIRGITENFKEIECSKLNKTERLETFNKLHQMITPIFQKRGWILQLIDPKHGCLLSGDRPVMLGGKSLQEPIELPNQTILLPLSPELLLVGNNNPVWGYASKPLNSTKEASLMSNILTLDHSHRFIFGKALTDIDSLFQNLNNTPRT